MLRLSTYIVLRRLLLRLWQPQVLRTSTCMSSMLAATRRTTLVRLLLLLDVIIGAHQAPLLAALLVRGLPLINRGVVVLLRRSVCTAAGRCWKTEYVRRRTWRRNVKRRAWWRLVLLLRTCVPPGACGWTCAWAHVRTWAGTCAWARVWTWAWSCEWACAHAFAWTCAWTCGWTCA